MKNVKVWIMTMVVLGLLAQVAQAAYTQGFESGEFVVAPTDPPITGVYNFAVLNSGWTLPANCKGFVVDASQASGYPLASRGNRYVSIDSRSAEALPLSLYYVQFTLNSGDARLETVPLQKVSFDFYVDPISDNTTGTVLTAYVRGNAAISSGATWAYLGGVKVLYTSGVWKLQYMNNGYLWGPTVTTGVWHHVDIHFDFSVQNGTYNGAKQTTVFDGNTLVANANCNSSTGCNVDTTQLATASPNNPFRLYWQVDRNNRTYVDNVSYSAETAPVATLSGTVAPGNFGGDLGMVGIKVQLLTPGTSTVVKTYKLTLSDTGTFSIPSVPQGIYDIAIQGSAWLRTVYANQNINSASFPLGTINLIGGDFNGSNGVDAADLSIVLANMDQAGQ